MSDVEDTPEGGKSGRAISPQDILGGLAIAGIGAMALWLTKDLAVGRAMRMGPGYLPQMLGWMVVIGGLWVTVLGFLGRGPGLESYKLRGPIFVLGAIIVFGVTVRWLGIAAASFLAVVTSSFASEEARPIEAVIYGIVLAAFCSLLFKVGLGLPLEIWPRALFG